MGTAKMDNIIGEVGHALAVESLQMTEREKENLRCVGRGEISFDDLIAQYVAEGRKMASAHAPSGDSRPGDCQGLRPDDRQGSRPDDCQEPRPDDCHDNSIDTYVYKGTDDLINKFGLRDFDEFSAVECAITGVTIAKLEAEPINGGYDLKHLKAIHHAIFYEIFDWAGQIRQQGYLAKGHSLFCGAEFIEPYARDLFAKLRKENLLRGLPRDKFAQRMAFYASEIDALHPFREGNGRTQRVFINQLARQAGWELNLWSVKSDTLLEAFIASMADEGPLAALLEGSITKR